MTYRTLQLLIILTTIFSIPRFSVLHVPHKAILPSISSDGVISLASVTTQTHDVALPTRKSPFDTGQGLAIPILFSVFIASATSIIIITSFLNHYQPLQAHLQA